MTMASFPVNFDMRFTEQVSIYRLAGSAGVPDAESLLIPLMRAQIIGTPMRMHDGDDWLFMTWQNLDNMINPWFPSMNFVLQTRAFVVVNII